MEPLCRDEGGPDLCPYVIVGCYCGHDDPDNPDQGYDGHDVCGGCGEIPDECDCPAVIYDA